ncbi:MAG: hypothetical protein R3F17_08930 [Planctomycetota bacterium]
MRKLLLGCFLATPCLAAAPQFTSVTNPEETYLLEALPPGSTTIHEMVTGDFNGDLLPEVMFRAGTTLGRMFAPGFQTDIDLSTQTCYSMVSVPTNAAGTTHALLVSQADGLKKVEWLAADPTVGTLPSVYWPPMVKMDVRQDASGITVVGLDGTAQVVYAIHTTDTFVSGTTTWTSYAPYTLPARVGKVKLAQWDSSGPAEVVVAFGPVIQVRSLPLATGTVYVNAPVGSAIVDFERVEYASSSRDDLAILTSDGNGGQLLASYTPWVS